MLKFGFKNLIYFKAVPPFGAPFGNAPPFMPGAGPPGLFPPPAGASWYL